MWSKYPLFLLLDEWDFKLYVYYAIAFWVVCLGAAMALGFAPLKTYLAGEIVFGLPTIYLTIQMLKGFTTWKVLALPALFFLESGVPAMWAVILLQRRWKLQRLHTPPVGVPGMRSLAIYLLVLFLLQAALVLAAKSRIDAFNQRGAGQFDIQLQRIAEVLSSIPSCAGLCNLIIGPTRLTRDLPDIDTPEQIEQAEKEEASYWNLDFCSVLPFLVNLGFAVGILQRRQPLKTFLAFYLADGLLSILVLVGDSGELGANALRGCLSWVPLAWATVLIVRRRRLSKRCKQF